MKQSSPYVRDQRSLALLVERLQGTEVIALDTEFLTERSYYPHLCLLQLATADVVAAVDPLDSLDLGLLRPVFEGADELVVHAGGQDLGILQRWLGVVPARVFDTQIAAAFLGYGHSVGYARLVEACSGVRLKRSSAYTDWAKRPLEKEQVEYALDDARYLLACRDELRTGLKRRERLGWAEEEFNAARAAALEIVDPREVWRRFSAARNWSGRDLAVLQELAAWREEEARRRDEPRQRIVHDRALVEIARRKPTDSRRLSAMRGLHRPEAKRSGEAIVSAIRRGLERSPESWPQTPVPRRNGSPAWVASIATLLDAFLRARAEQVELSTRLVATRKDLEALVRRFHAFDGRRGDGDPPSYEQLALMRGWRRDVAGEDLLRLLRGELRLGIGSKGGTLSVEVSPIS